MSQSSPLLVRRHDYAALIELLQSAGIAFGAVNDVAGLSTIRTCARLAVATPGGEARLPAPPAIFAGEPSTPAAVPALGQHTRPSRSSPHELRHRARRRLARPARNRAPPTLSRARPVLQAPSTATSARSKPACRSRCSGIGSTFRP